MWVWAWEMQVPARYTHRSEDSIQPVVRVETLVDMSISDLSHALDTIMMSFTDVSTLGDPDREKSLERAGNH